MTEARPLTDAEFEREGRPALSRVFPSVYPLAIDTSLSGRALLFPVETELPDEQLEAVAAAADAVSGDDGFFYTPTEGPTVGLQLRGVDGELHAVDPDIAYLARHWWVPFGDWTQYHLSVDAGGESVMFSPRGAWGVFVSHMDYAVAAGSTAFVDALLTSWPVDNETDPPTPAAAAAPEFVKHVRWLMDQAESDYAMTWLPDLLKAVYGQGTASRLLDGE